MTNAGIQIKLFLYNDYNNETFVLVDFRLMLHPFYDTYTVKSGDSIIFEKKR
jgi:hypothetical protein